MSEEKISDKQEIRRITEMLHEKEAFISELQQEVERKKIVIRQLCVMVADLTTKGKEL